MKYETWCEDLGDIHISGKVFSLIACSGSARVVCCETEIAEEAVRLER